MFLLLYLDLWEYVPKKFRTHTKTVNFAARAVTRRKMSPDFRCFAVPRPPENSSKNFKTVLKRIFLREIRSKMLAEPVATMR